MLIDSIGCEIEIDVGNWSCEPIMAPILMFRGGSNRWRIQIIDGGGGRERERERERGDVIVQSGIGYFNNNKKSTLMIEFEPERGRRYVCDGGRGSSCGGEPRHPPVRWHRPFWVTVTLDRRASAVTATGPPGLTEAAWARVVHRRPRRVEAAVAEAAAAASAGKIDNRFSKLFSDFRLRLSPPFFFFLINSPFPSEMAFMVLFSCSRFSFHFKFFFKYFSPLPAPSAAAVAAAVVVVVTFLLFLFQ